MTNRNALIGLLRQYETPFPSEENFREKFLALLASERAFFRDHLPGHLTGSAWIVDETHTRTLLTHHAKLNRWLQPGGHADGDENIFNVALREAEEETGLKNLKLVGDGFFDIDIHSIPARKEFPEHLHYDVRFLFEASSQEPLFVTEESHALAWKELNELPDLVDGSESILRMAAKVKKAILR